ncbi:Ni/Fe hydrogenase subunit alpha [Thiohalocapsa marina]|uniref:Ni/Fe hydrogenase subunit alpha n=1 Tax=Thiohalocapsa marina TaxID=424902 RepID=A0A5M8FLM4_9GAMM|nr:Ni/Fe hydrogenase subunit alpha [Thiohalocapsa marina]KAA6185833.1 Ni/Fe hydrogenase subunit alpha [Thiohalocapsa marina]
MPSQLETASHPQGLKRVAIEPVTRVEGHGKVTLLLDEDDHVQQARLHIVEFRGFEKFIQGRPFWELPVLVQRLCGICPVSHHLAAAKACDRLVGVDQLTSTAEKVRRLMHFGQILQSHALHFFHLSSPDLLFGFDDPVAHRNIIGVLDAHPDIARQGVLLRKYGQEVIRITSGKRIHGTGAIPGGVNKAVSASERDLLQADIGQVVQWAVDGVALMKRLFGANAAAFQRFGTIDANSLSLVRPDGELELYHGGLRARDATGSVLFDHADVADYQDLLAEQVKPWSYMKFPFIRALGPEAGWYRVGPLARVGNCDAIDTPLAERERQEFVAMGQGRPVQATLATHWARLIELLHCAEAIERLLQDPDLGGRDLLLQGEPRRLGIGVIEAPRGTLFHHYEIDADGLVRKANLIVSTTNNNQAMNESIRQVALDELDGRRLTEPLLNRIEVAIRAYDPCLSCATHALGKMPLELELLDADGAVLDRLRKRADGNIVDDGHCSAAS